LTSTSTASTGLATAAPTSRGCSAGTCRPLGVCVKHGWLGSGNGV
jgi:hypothetical protein